jgi:hypothetical protein
MSQISDRLSDCGRVGGVFVGVDEKRLRVFSRPKLVEEVNFADQRGHMTPYYFTRLFKESEYYNDGDGERRQVTTFLDVTVWGPIRRRLGLSFITS